MIPLPVPVPVFSYLDVSSDGTSAGGGIARQRKGSVYTGFNENESDEI